MNKKKMLTFVLPLLAIALVSAFVGYYALFSASFNVLPSITIGGETEQVLGNVYDGQTIIGEEITLTNEAPTRRELTITDDAEYGIEVSYLSELILAQKVVDFGEPVWDLLPDGDTAVVEYVVVGNEFTAEIKSGEKEGYVLVYYKDNSDRFNSPATAIGIDSIVGNLAYEDDANNDEYDYCVTGEYITCHGAKIWYVPETAVDSEGNVDWSQAGNILFETELIQYNSDGEIIIYPGQSLSITPVYNIGVGVSGTQIVTTAVA